MMKMKRKKKITFKEFEIDRPAECAKLFSQADDYIVDCLIKKFFEQNKNRVVSVMSI